ADVALAAAARLAAAQRGAPEVQRLLLRLLFAPDGPVRRLAALPPETAAPDLAALRHLAALAATARRDPPTPHAASEPGAFLAWLQARLAAGDSRVPAPETAGDAVPVLTIHAAKGREFPVVYIPNLAMGRFPPRARPAAAPLPPNLDPSPEPVNFEEEAALLFVAMSRARDVLVMSHAASYDGRPAAPSPLLDRLSGVFAALPPPLLRWNTAKPAPSPAAPSTEATAQAASSPAAANVVEYDDVVSYRRCPRQHFYRKVAALGEPQNERGADGSLLGAGVAATLRWLWRETERGVTATPDDAAAFFVSWWEQQGGPQHPYAADVAQAGTEAVRRAAALPRQPGAPWRMTVAHGGVRLAAQADAAEQTESGALRLVIALTGGPGEAERAAARAAALRAGARQAGYTPTVETVALITGDRRPLPDNPAEGAERLSLLAASARSMAAGEFPAHPDRRSRCQTCPFVLICPD
ncbi:MAG: PD-(D/E)XK nuclease family protein, partial [Chloroflexi bacterium]|nr:PD-(D/E)XK nuclease family protein [Chloroflexota bacterium]